MAHSAPQPPAQIPTPTRRSTEPFGHHHDALWDEDPPFPSQASPDYDHAAIGRGRGRASRLRAGAGAHSTYGYDGPEFGAPLPVRERPFGDLREKKDARAINYSETSWPAPYGHDQPAPHPYAAQSQPQGDAHPRETDAALGSPFRTPPSSQPELVHAGNYPGNLPSPPAAADRAPPRPRHPPVSGSTTAVTGTGRGRSASAGSTGSAGGVNKDKILQDLADALAKERKKGKALGAELVKGEEEIDSIRLAFEAFKRKHDGSHAQHQAVLAAVQVEIGHVCRQLETAYDLSALDAAKYVGLLQLAHPNLEPRLEPVVTSFSREALNAPSSPTAKPPSPTQPRKLVKSKGSKNLLLDSQLAIARGDAPRPGPEEERGRESMFRRVVRAVSRSRSRSRTREAGMGEGEGAGDEVRVVPVAEDGKSRPPVSGWGTKAAGTRTRSNSLTKALKGVGKASKCSLLEDE